MALTLKELSIDDGIPVYDMLQKIKSNENEFKNPVYGMTYNKFQDWLVVQSDWSKGENLPQGYVGQTICWLYEDNIPVGYGKIRHRLTEQSRIMGGNIGYAIDPEYRGKGYGTILLDLLIKKAKEMDIQEILLTVEKYNLNSKKVIENNNGRLVAENDKRWFFAF